MSDSKKSKKELMAELEALRAKMRVQQDETAASQKDDGNGMTRRDVLSAAWVAPVILTVPLAGVAPKVQAQPIPSVPIPTDQPTMMPTDVPTPMPTDVPTMMPTDRPPQTPEPSIPATTPPTSAPTAFPTAAASVIPVELSDFDIK